MFITGSCYYFFFFFSSRRRHTRSLCDWSSDVCSSDLTTRLLYPASCSAAVGKSAVGHLISCSATTSGWVRCSQSTNTATRLLTLLMFHVGTRTGSPHALQLFLETGSIVAHSADTGFEVLRR